jgi:hypothetical protein
MYIILSFSVDTDQRDTNTEGTIKNKLSSDTGINGYKTEKTNKQTKNTMQKTKFMSNTDSTKKLENNQGVRNG